MQYAAPSIIKPESLNVPGFVLLLLLPLFNSLPDDRYAIRDYFLTVRRNVTSNIVHVEVGIQNLFGIVGWALFSRRDAKELMSRGTTTCHVAQGPISLDKSQRVARVKDSKSCKSRESTHEPSRCS